MEKKTHRTRGMRYDTRCKQKDIVEQKDNRAERYEKRCLMKNWDSETEEKIKLEVRNVVSNEIQDMMESPVMLTRSRTKNKTFFF